MAKGKSKKLSYTMRKGRRGKYRGRRRTYGYGLTNTGMIYLKRKMPDMAISNSGVLGQVNLVDNIYQPCITLGTTTASIGSNTGYDVPFAMRFSLKQIISSGDITQLCDKYKIIGVHVRIYYNKTGSAAGAQAGYPYLQYITDHDDATAPSLLTLKEKMGVKLKTFVNGSSYIGFKCIPKPSREIYGASGSVAYEIPAQSVWLNSSSSDTEHFGIKGILQNVFLPAGNQGTEVFKFDVTLRILGKDFQ